MRSRAPLVGTGVERLVARDSGTSRCRTQNDGVVEEVDASRVVIRRFAKGGELGANVDIYNFTKYQRTNQNTCFNQKPIVNVGDKVVRKGDIIADGPSTELTVSWLLVKTSSSRSRLGWATTSKIRS